MNRDYLIETAGSIAPVSESAAEAYEKKIEIMTSEINESFLARNDLNELINEANIEMMKDNHHNHARFIHSLLVHYSPEVFVDTILWVFKAYRSHGFSSIYWAAQLNSWIELIKKHLDPESYNQIAPLYYWMQINIPVFTMISNDEIDAGKSQH